MDPLDSSFQSQHEENLEKLIGALSKAIISLEDHNNFGKNQKDEGLASSGLTKGGKRLFTKDRKEHSLSSSPFTKGGIDLNPNNFNFKTTSSSLRFNLPLETIRQFQASSGLAFQIMKIEKGVDLKSLLGIEEEEKEMSYLSPYALFALQLFSSKAPFKRLLLAARTNAIF